MAFGGLNPQSILVGMTIMVLLVVVIIAFASLFLSQFSYQLTQLSGINTTAAQSAITQGQSSINTIPGWLPIIILAFILLVVLGIIAVVALVAWRMQGGAQQ